MEFTDEEVQNILGAFKALKVKPKADTPEDFAKWMADFTGSMGAFPVKEEPASSHATASIASGHIHVTFPHELRISVFSGDSKSEASYELWRYEVTCLQQGSYPHDQVSRAIRRSLRGEAGRITMRLGPTASISEILSKLDSVYSNVDLKETLLADFYSARQKDNEDIATWTVQKGLVKTSETNDMLKAMLWTGLKQTLKDVSGHKFDSLKTFDELRVALRRIESEHKQREDELKQNKKTTHLNMASTSTTSQTKEISDLKDLVQQLSQEVKFLKENSVSHLSNNQQSYGSRFRTDNTMKKRDRTCWRCGQVGHIASACRVRLDHSKRDLNSMRPMAGGKQ
ncbi:hypothetical protein ACJMK2_019663 [Sinanodonta woodiana]|uniref:CCHC-type domain-containing protein n=1 Tax=Sinanodonta woodiana TaxID=1069815 RepID=A0ABD3TWN7_SINWO